ncbi:hypothetical protein P9A16_31690 [Shinella sp. 838]|uniref:hypothetical protein n=1 Tax=Shinella sp. 838 TaxID=3038164 RepID=UPI002414EC6C|nr:hypothetical protein [Shinella sp. 838]MDG4675665.1 hypothetical protein [Shinella sp. 838]
MIKSGYTAEDLQGMEAMRKRQALADALIGGGAPQQINHPMQGLAQMAQTAMTGNQQRNAMFPQAPGGAMPSIGTQIRNMVSRGNNGGMY